MEHPQASDYLAANMEVYARKCPNWEKEGWMDIENGVCNEGSHAGDVSVVLDGVGSGVAGGGSRGACIGNGWNWGVDLSVSTARMEVLSWLLK